MIIATQLPPLERNRSRRASALLEKSRTSGSPRAPIVAVMLGVVLSLSVLTVLLWPVDVHPDLLVSLAIISLIVVVRLAAGAGVLSQGALR